MTDRDAIYRRPKEQLVDFVFDESVVRVFPDMIRRSVPGYETVVPLSGLIAARYAQSGTRCYDLGSSLGATSLAITRQLGDKDCTVYAIDNSAAMVERAQREIDESRIQWVAEDIRTAPIENASAVVMNYTLQFIPPAERLTLLKRIHDALVPGGALVVSEKIRFDDAEIQQRNESLHLGFKKANGYSDLEISQKRSALERVMRPDTEAEHVARFADAGFGTVDTWFRCLNWMSFLALRR